MDAAAYQDSIDALREAGYEAKLRDIVLELCKAQGCGVFLFGSRVRGQLRRSSDFDIGITGLSRDAFCRTKRCIEDRIEESDIPHAVDVVDFERASEPFRSAAMKDRIIWKTG